MQAFILDLRYGARMLLKKTGFTAVAAPLFVPLMNTTFYISFNYPLLKVN